MTSATKNPALRTPGLGLDWEVARILKHNNIEPARIQSSSLFVTLRIIGDRVEPRLQPVGNNHELTDADRQLAEKIARAADAILQGRAA